MRFLNLIEAVTFLCQYQRETRELVDKTTGEVIEYVESTVEDYAIAYKLIRNILPATLDDLSKNSRDLYELIREYVKGRAAEEKKDPAGITFTRRELREYSKWSNDQIKNHIQQLEEMEYVAVERGTRGQPFTYRLLSELIEPEDITRRIPTPQELEMRLKSAGRRPRKVG